jgi:hypothetical protein
MRQRRVSGGNSWTIWIITGLAFTAMTRSAPAADPEIEADALRPGLIATHSAKVGNDTIRITRLEPAIALALKAGESPHPRLSAENGKTHWEGYLTILRAGEYRFQLRLNGKFRLSLDGKDVLTAESATGEQAVSEKAVKLEAGPHFVIADFDRIKGAAAVEVRWSCTQFRNEPLARKGAGRTGP